LRVRRAAVVAEQDHQRCSGGNERNAEQRPRQDAFALERVDVRVAA
jgi:hypothetical protein